MFLLAGAGRPNGEARLRGSLGEAAIIGDKRRQAGSNGQRAGEMKRVEGAKGARFKSRSHTENGVVKTNQIDALKSLFTALENGICGTSPAQRAPHFNPGQYRRYLLRPSC